MGDCPRQCSPKAPRPWLREATAERGLQAAAWSTTKTKACMPITWCKDGHWPVMLGPTAPTKVFCLWMDAKSCCWGGYEQRMSFWAILLKSPDRKMGKIVKGILHKRIYLCRITTWKDGWFIVIMEMTSKTTIRCPIHPIKSSDEKNEKIPNHGEHVEQLEFL